MFFGFQLTCGLMLVFYGYSVMKNPRVWGDQGRQAVKAENFPEYCRQNGLFFLKAGFLMALIGALDALVTLSGLLYVLLYLFGLAFAFYPLTRWCKENEGFSCREREKAHQKAASAAGGRKGGTRRKVNSKKRGRCKSNLSVSLCSTASLPRGSLWRRDWAFCHAKASPR